MQLSQGAEIPVRTTGDPAVPGGGSGASAVSWGAIIAGTAVAAASSLVLFALAAGFDLASVSAWPRRGLSGSALTTLAAITLVVTQWISAGLGGYITGRLRTRWVGTHTHEVFFRDTAHGFITWCVATVLIASGVISPAPSSPTAALRMGSVGAGTAAVAPAANPAPVAQLAPMAPVAGWAPRAAFAPDLATASDLAVNPAAAMTVAPGIVVPGAVVSLQAAEEEPAGRARLVSINRLTEVQLADAADARAAAASSVLTALSMLVGAFIACVTAAVGGRLRDLHP